MLPIIFFEKVITIDINHILTVLKSMTPEQYTLVNKMVRDELEYRILAGDPDVYNSPEEKQEAALIRVRLNLKKTY